MSHSEDGHAKNRSIYRSKVVIEDFSGPEELTEAETFIFRHISPAKRILDVGIGTGRTTPHLAREAKSYLGADYSEAMLEVFRKKHPEVECRLVDVSHPLPFENESFDAIVFSFNGLDYLVSTESRVGFLREAFRTLGADGVLIFSSHNPKCIFAPMLGDKHSGRARIHSLLQSIAYFRALFFSSAFWTNNGYFRDSYAGLVTHAASVQEVVRETEANGFRLLEVVGSLYPKAAAVWSTPWFYYAFQKKAPTT